MKILFVGDIYARPGKMVASRFIPKIIAEEGVDFCVANGENAAGGFGMTENIADKLFSYGIDVITSGNHIWDRREIETMLQKSHRLLRPENYPSGVPGRGYTVVHKGGKSLGVMNLIGRIFMQPVDCPFRTADAIVDILRRETRNIIVDFHAESTSEKIALGMYLDGRISGLFGTHTHVMTADERIFHKGTAFISDAGMTGSHDSVIGVVFEQSLARIMTQVPVRFSPAEKGLKFSGVLVETEDISGKAISIKRIFEDADE